MSKKRDLKLEVRFKNGEVKIFRMAVAREDLKGASVSVVVDDHEVLGSTLGFAADLPPDLKVVKNCGQ